MKKSTEPLKSTHARRPQEAALPKKQFELLYRERDPEAPFENIIFMKSKKCDHPNKQEPLPKRKSREQPVQQLKDMVAQLERQLDKRHRTSKAKPPSSGKDLFKNKQIKETFHTRASSKWNKYRKQEAIAANSNSKYRNMLSPSRNNAKPKEDTLSSKFLRSTQETFRKEKSRPSKQHNIPQAPFTTEPEEYILLENNFVQLTNEDASLLQLKITSNKTMCEIKPFQQAKAAPSKRCSLEDQPSMHQSCVVREVSEYQPQMEVQFMNQEDQTSNESYDEEISMRVMELFMLSKVRLIQRWWRQVLSKKNKPLDPIIFRKCNQDFQESMLFLRSSEVSPIKMIDHPHADRKDEVQEKPDPLQLREQAAEHQLKTHLQLLQQLLEEGRIGGQSFQEKKALIEARYQHQLQQVQQLQKLMSENTQRAYQMTIKTQQDRTKLQSITSEIDEHTLDLIFGKDYTIPSPPALSVSATAPSLPPSYEMMIVNREKSTGCHFDQEKTKPSIYQKHAEEDYSEDFQEEEQGQGQDGLDEYNANFSQLLDEYKSRQEVKVEIERRAAIQMGALMEQIPEQVRAGRVGIDTSLNSIHRFVLSFFKFYIFYYRDEFLRLINMPYGYSINRRLAFMHGYDAEEEPEEDESGVIYGLEALISDQILDEFYEKVYNISGGMDQVQLANLEFERVHSRALLDCFNQGLNHFRPYFFINGPPYPWNHSEKALTFYYIAEQNIQEVFEKTQFKLLRWASSLCGIMPNTHTPCPDAQALPAEQALELYRSHTHPDLVETREERLTKQEKMEVAESAHEWNFFEEQATMLRMECADHIFTKLIEELTHDLLPPANPLATFDFFDGLSEEESDEDRA